MNSADKSRHTLLGQAVSLLGQALAPRVTLGWEGDDGPRGDGPESGWVQLTWHTTPDSATTRFQQHLVVTDDPEAAVPLTDTVWVLAGRASRVTRDRLRERGTSFIHPASGAVYLTATGLLVDRVVPRSRASRPTAGAAVDPFADRASQVLRVLLRSALHSEPRAWGVRELAEAASVDRTTTSRVLERLEGWQLVERARRPGARGRALAVRLLDPVKLLDRWSASYDWTSNARLRVHAPIGSTARFLERLPERLVDVRWALTLQAGAALLAPHAEWDILHVYVDVASDAALEEIAARHGWAPGDDGRLVLMRPHYRTSLWTDVTQVRGRPVVGITQLLIDLWRYPVRGREQAEHLLDLRDRLPPMLFGAGAMDV